MESNPSLKKLLALRLFDNSKWDLFFNNKSITLVKNELIKSGIELYRQFQFIPPNAKAKFNHIYSSCQIMDATSVFLLYRLIFDQFDLSVVFKFLIFPQQCPFVSKFRYSNSKIMKNDSKLFPFLLPTPNFFFTQSWPFYFGGNSSSQFHILLQCRLRAFLVLNVEDNSLALVHSILTLKPCFHRSPQTLLLLPEFYPQPYILPSQSQQNLENLLIRNRFFRNYFTLCSMYLAADMSRDLSIIS